MSRSSAPLKSAYMQELFLISPYKTVWSPVTPFHQISFDSGHELLQLILPPHILSDCINFIMCQPNQACQEMGLEISNYKPHLYSIESGSLIQSSADFKSAGMYCLICQPEDQQHISEYHSLYKLTSLADQLQVQNYNDLKIAPELKHGYNKVTSQPTPGLIPEFQEKMPVAGFNENIGRQHYLLARSARSRRSFFCPLITCLKQSKHSGDLRIHFRTHTGEKPFACPFCSLKFLKKTQLHEHVKATSNRQNYSCPHQKCSAIFQAECQLIEHIKSHSPTYNDPRNNLVIRRAQSVKCVFCPKRFKSSQELQAHTLTHQVSQFSCPMCAKSFTDLTQLQMHIRLHRFKSSIELMSQYTPYQIQTVYKILLIKHFLILCFQYSLRKAAAIPGALQNITEIFQKNLVPILATHPTQICQPLEISSPQRSTARTYGSSPHLKESPQVKEANPESV